jgi:N-acetylglucosamine kinase-like BadF-type ATPase
MLSSKRKVSSFRNGRYPASWRATLGVDGGGTKTRAVILDQNLDVLGESVAGPSNPLRVGVAGAAAAIREAVEKACDASGLRRADLVAAEIGLAGVRRPALRARMHDVLNGLGLRDLLVVSDAEIALYAATEGAPGLIVIAGTGSICCGINARGKQACAGGWGPLAGDEGGGAWIARRGLRAIAYASDGRGPATSLSAAAGKYFRVSNPIDLSTAIYAPAVTNEYLAGFGKYVIQAAKAKDRVAREILVEAGKELGLAAATVIRNLKLQREAFPVGYVGGVFAASGELVLSRLRTALLDVAPRAFLTPPKFSPAVAAARMAHERLQDIALAV